MKKESRPKMILSKETIRRLENPEPLRDVVGGFSYIYTVSGCVACFCPDPHP